MANNRQGSRAVVLVVALFLLGGALGALGMRLFGDRYWCNCEQPHERGAIVARLTRELSLNPAQQAQLATILEDTRGKYDALYEQQRPLYDQVRAQGRDRIRAILTPEQLPKFEEFVRHLDEERKKREKH